jgi:ATP-dependent Lhr-like helicase
MDVMAGFHPAVRAWFEERFSAPSPPQQMGWPVIRAGENSLILAATGSGKTLAAFLEILDRLYVRGTGKGVQVVYVSPLKALNNDIARNLTAPLGGIAAAAAQMGITLPTVKVAVRTGDTPQSARQAMLRKPPDILITTPESLYLLLSSPRARHILASTHTVIVDEIHALAGNKRGVHLALSLERLQHLASRDLQRIGLSATQRPLDTIAKFLGGAQAGVPRPVRIIDALMAKYLAMQVQLGPQSFAPAAGRSMWPDIHEKVLREVQAHRSTLVFVNSRALAERLTLGINEAAGTMLAKTHHGSLSRTAREEVEAALKKGELRALVCTSTLELGIDVGAIDLVIQIASPRSPSSGLQRAGRSGHVLGAASKMLFLTKSPDDLLDTAWVAREMRIGHVEETHIPENCLDVLAQQIVAMIGVEPWAIDALWQLARQSYPFRNLGREQLLSIVEMLSGRYPARDFIELRPKIAWDRTTDTLQALPGTRAAAIAGAGTIPDRGYYGVYIAGQSGRVGELEEEFVFESHRGDAFILGNAIWRIQSITDNRVVVAPAPEALPKMPFWKGDRSGRDLEAGRRLGAFWRELAGRLADPGVAQWLTTEVGLDAQAASELTEYLNDQLRHTGCIPSDRRLLLESYIDQAGDHRIILHSPYGYRLHAAWEMVARQRAREELGYELTSVATDYGIAWHMPRGQVAPPVETLVYLGNDIEQRLISELPSTALFGAHFRMAAARSLVLGRSSPKRRVPLWLQRVRAGDLLSMVRKESSFPVALEAFRECLQDVLDVPGLTQLQRDLTEGIVQVEYRQSVTPSPFARTFVLQLTGENMYSDDTPRAEKKAQFLTLDRELLGEMLGENQLRELLDPTAIAATIARRQRSTTGSQARNADELEEILLDVGDLTLIEAQERITSATALSELVQAGRAILYRFGVAPTDRIIAAEEWDLFSTAFGPGEGAPQVEAQRFLVKRYARTHGPFTAAELALRYGWSEALVVGHLDTLCSEGLLQKGAFLPNETGIEWCHRDVLQEIHRRTLSQLRHEVEAVAVADYSSFLFNWQQVGNTPQKSGVEALAEVLDQLSGLFLPVEVWERDVLPARLPGYDPAWLDLLCARGEFVWVMQPGGSPDRGRVGFFRHDDVSALLPLLVHNVDQPVASPAAQKVEGILQQHGAAFTRELLAAWSREPDELGGMQQLQSALWELSLLGRVTNDTFAPVRQGKPADSPTDATKEAPPVAWGRRPQGREMAHLRRALRRRVELGLDLGGGRWSLLAYAAPDGSGNSELPADSDQISPLSPDQQRWALERLAEVLVGRYGVLCRQMLLAEGIERLWPPLYRTLRVMEMTGRVRSGYFVTGLAGSQFAHPHAVEELRAVRSGQPDTDMRLLSAWDPACAAGPICPAELPMGTGFSRSSLNYVIYGRGQMLLYISGYGKSLWSPIGRAWSDTEQALTLLPQLLAIPGHQRPRRSICVATFNGQAVLETPAAVVLRNLGFQVSGDSLILWPSQLRTGNDTPSE